MPDFFRIHSYIKRREIIKEITITMESCSTITPKINLRFEEINISISDNHQIKEPRNRSTIYLNAKIEETEACK